MRGLCYAEGVAEAAFQGLAHILQPMHGSVEDHSAYTLRQLMAGLLGLSESSTDSKDTNYQRSAATIRGSIIAFATQCCRCGSMLTVTQTRKAEWLAWELPVSQVYQGHEWQ